MRQDARSGLRRASAYGVDCSLRRDSAATGQVTADVVASSHQTDDEKNKEADDPEASATEASATARGASSVFDIAA